MKKMIYGILIVIGLLILTITCLELFSSYTAAEHINKNAPVQTVQEFNIHASPQKIYQIMSDINHWADWQTGIKKPVLKGNFEKGSSFDWKTGGLSIHSTLHTVIPDAKIGWSGKAFGSFAIHNWEFIPHDGYTTVRVEESMEGWLVSLMSKKIKQGLDESLELWLKNLKAKAEQ